MSVFIKICGIRDAETAAAAVAAGANAIGFVFAESVRRVTTAEANEAAAAIPADVTRVAVMKRPSREEWQEVLDEFAPDALQTDIVDFAELDVPGSVQSWPVYREGGRIPAEDLPYVFVYEGASSGAGETVDWKRAAQVAQKGRLVLAGGLDAGNVASAIRTVQPWGVDVSSGVESQPGRKDVNRIGEFISAVRAAEKQA
jgi:phosphoribosylanthranilate isomerase